jgi:uncharacterized membrane-anchored protein YitT (DUF2179 family)
MVVGSLIFSFAINYFIIANGLAEGGFTGVALIAHYLFDWPVGLVLAALNLPLLIFSWYRWGLSFIIKTIFCVAVVSVSIDLFQGMKLQTDDLLLAALYGGVASGAGLGIVLRCGGTTGGMDIIARWLHEKYNINMGTVFFSFDVVVIGAVAFLFGLDKALYTLVALFIFSQVVDRFIEGLNEARAVFIVSQSTLAITQAILKEMDRGVTVLKGYGAYTSREKDILYVVVGITQVLQLKKIVRQLDPYAFVTVNKVHEVLGEGFRNPL